MSTKTVLILSMALFTVVFSMPASKQAAPAEDMKTAETIYRSWAPSSWYGYRTAYTLPSTMLNLNYRTAYTMPLAYRSAAAAIPYYSGWNYESPTAYSSLSDLDCL